MNDRPLNNFDATVLEQMAHIRAVGRKRLRNQNELDDFVQETVARVYANRDQLRDPAKLKQWIAGIARNTANELNRAGFRRREVPLPNEDELPDMRDPHEQLERAERNEQIRQAMNRLNPIDRDLLQGRYMEEESYADLQERHGLSYSAVGFRLHRAKRRLRKLLTGMKVALALALANMKRTAFGGMLIMTKTTKIVLVAASALMLALLGGYLWIEYGGSPDDSARGLTVEDQSPRIEQKSAETPKQTDDETAAPAQEETSASDESAAEESAVLSDDSESVISTLPDAPQAASQDPLTVELQDALEEYVQFTDYLQSRFPNPLSVNMADVVNRLSDELTRYDKQLLSQNLTREERIAKLKARVEQITDQAEEPAIDESDPAQVASMEAMARYGEANMPRKLIALLGLDWQ